MRSVLFLFISALIAICASQRSPYAGRRPIGFPALETVTSTPRNDSLGNRFGENGTTTTQRLPVEALGDRNLFNRLGQLPQDKQPFWYINWQALEQNRQRPQSYPQKPNVFAEFPVMSDQSVRIAQTVQTAQNAKQQPAPENNQVSGFAQTAENNAWIVE